MRFFLGLLIFAVPLAHSSLALYHLKWVVLGLITPLIAYLWLRSGPLSSPLPRLLSPIVLLLIVAVLSLLQAINLYYGLQQITFVLNLFLIYLVVADAATSPRGRLQLVRCLILTLSAVSVVSLYFYLLHRIPDPTAPGRYIQSHVLVQLFGNNNYGAAYLITVIPLSLALFLMASSGWQRAWWVLTTFLSLVCLFLSRTKGAWVGIFVGLGVFFWVFYRQARVAGGQRSFLRSHLLPLGLLGGAAVAVAYALYPEGGLEFLERAKSIFDPQIYSLQTRLALWDGTLRMIFDHPWTGVGVGNFPFAYVPYRSAVHYDRPAMRIEHPHNEYLAIWSELGIIGLLLLLWLVVRILRLGWQLAERSERDKGVLAGILGGLAASALYANFFYVFHVPASAMNVAVLLGILEGMDREERVEGQGLSLGHPIVLVVVFVIFLFTFQYSLRPFMGDVYTQLAERDLAVGKIEAGLKHLETALRWHPQDFVARYRRAALYLQTRRFPEAIQEAKAVLKVHPNLQLAYGVMATAHVGLGDTATAKDLYQRALTINPYYTHALNNLGVILLEEGKVGEAEALLKKAIAIIDINTGETTAHGNLGALYRKAGRYREAIEVYRQAARFHSKWSSYLWYTTALLRNQEDEGDAAYAALARAIYLDEQWRQRAANEPSLEEWRRKEARVRVLLNLE